MQGVGDDDGHAGHAEDIEEQDGKGRCQTCFVTDLGFGDFGNGLAVVPHGAEEDDHIVDGTGEYTADENPQGTGQVAELGCDDRTDQRAGTGDSCEMVAENDVFVRRYIVVTVFKTEGRCDFVLVQGQYLGGDESAVKTVSQYEH